MIKLYLCGLCILVTAILLNIFALKVGLDTWYSFGPHFFNKGLSCLNQVKVQDLFWLFFLYPLLLSCGYLLGIYIYNLI